MQYIIGFLTGLIFTTIISYVSPQNVRGVNEELVRLGMAHYDRDTGIVKWHIPDKTIKDK